MIYASSNFMWLFLHVIFVLQLERILCLLGKVQTYDLVDIKVIGPRNKRSLYSIATDDRKFQREADAEIIFKYFSKTFHLLLYEDQSFYEMKIQSSHHKTDIKNVTDKLTFYEGIVKNISSFSSAVGYLYNGFFTGNINDGKSMYFLEPASSSFTNMKNSKKTVVYRIQDISPLEWRIHENFTMMSKLTDQYRSVDLSLNRTVLNSGIEITNKTGNIFCEIEMVADHTLFEHFKKDYAKLVGSLYLHGKFADDIFRKTDFNMDGKPDGIRIAVKEIYIYKSPTEPNYPMAKSLELSDYLSKFTTRLQKPQFCLSMGLTYRKYKGLSVGEAFRAEFYDTQAFGGICDAPAFDIRNIRTMFFNTGVMNLRHPNGTPLPLGITTLVLAHEMGHSFGSDHDPIEESACSPGRHVGNYLMYPISSPDSKHGMIFSPCSRTSIWNILQGKGGCLKMRNGTCGNGIQEGTEECDCGPPESCNIVDPCCTPLNPKSPSSGCKLRRSKGAICSPKESGCCNRDCKIIQNNGTLCYEDAFRCMVSYCDGLDADCPTPMVDLAGDACRLKSIACDGGTCNRTVCQAVGATDCHCKDNLINECLVCCRKNETSCIPASEMGLFTAALEQFVLEPGKKCNKGLFQCDGFGNCLDTKKGTQVMSPSLQASIVIVCSILSVFLSIIMYVHCFKSMKSQNQPLIPLVELSSSTRT